MTALPSPDRIERMIRDIEKLVFHFRLLQAFSAFVAIVCLVTAYLYLTIENPIRWLDWTVAALNLAAAVFNGIQFHRSCKTEMDAREHLARLRWLHNQLETP